MSTLLAPTSRSSRLPSRFLVAGGLAALAAGGSLALALLSLHLADGVTFLGDSSYDTEFLDPAILRLVPVLLPVLGLAAYYSGRVGLLALVARHRPAGRTQLRRASVAPTRRAGAPASRCWSGCSRSASCWPGGRLGCGRHWPVSAGAPPLTDLPTERRTAMLPGCIC